MSTAILTLSENGGLQRLHDKWLTRSACSSEGTKQGVDRLQLQSFWGLFILCGSVCLLALLFYLIKMIREYTRHSRQISPQSGRLRSFLSFVKEKEDHHHEEAEGKSPKAQGQLGIRGSTVMEECMERSWWLLSKRFPCMLVFNFYAGYIYIYM